MKEVQPVFDQGDISAISTSAFMKLLLSFGRFWAAPCPHLQLAHHLQHSTAALLKGKLNLLPENYMGKFALHELAVKKQIPCPAAERAYE